LPFFCDNSAQEGLVALFVPFDNAGLNADGVADVKDRDFLFQIGRFYFLNN
jgi:hypothetical protein